MATLSAMSAFLLSEPLALDLLNTRIYLADEWQDLLDHRELRTVWLSGQAERLGISAEDARGFTDAVASVVKRVREQAGATIEPARHGVKPPARALSALNDVLRAAPSIPQASWDGESISVATDRTGPFSAQLAARFAAATVDLLAGPDIRQVRRCAAPTCTALFLARNPRRRWCTPNICGNRARVARYYLRHKSELAGP